MPSVVAVIEPDSQARAAIVAALRGASLDSVGFGGAQEFIAAAAMDDLSCIVASFELTDMRPTTLQERLNAGGSFVPLVFVARSASVPDAVAAMKNGAADFIAAPYSTETVLASVRQAVGRAALYRLFEREARHASRLDDLSDREREVLELVVRGLSTKQIAFELGRVEKTIEFHRRNLMRKLGANNVADLVRIVALATARDVRRRAVANGAAMPRVALGADGHAPPNGAVIGAHAAAERREGKT